MSHLRAARRPYTPAALPLKALLPALLAGWLAAPLHAAGAPEAALLVQQLRQGGYVLVMRHTDSPDQLPTAQSAEPDNTRHERQLSETGKQQAGSLGTALHTLAVPIGPIYSSPTYRALQTVRLAGLGTAQVVAALTEGPRGMQGTAAAAQVHWLQQAIERPPPPGSNILIVTHTPNIVGAFGAAASQIQSGEMLVYQPPAAGSANNARARLLGRLTIDEWRALAAAH